ncbi:MAG: hypothetical protein ACREA9_23220 [Pyrinomonadaceae bacterium]
MTPTELPMPSIDKFMVWGPMGVLFVVGMYFVLRYGHRILDGHVSFMETAKTTQTTLADSYRTLSERDDVDRTNRALGHIVNAAKEATDSPGIHKHLDRAGEELSR